MFSHIGKTRTPRHNLGIASLLSFVAGLVNVVGFFSVQKLTTNVTGHFAFFVDEVFKLNFENAFHVALFVFYFFFGAFFANFTVEIYSRIRENETYVFPIITEALILTIIAFTGNYLIKTNPDVIAYSLLFAMGMQNSLVTSISKSIVRTTHLTGLFTDMGIEFSQLFFYKDQFHKRRLLKSIKLRVTIIFMFFVGGVSGGILFEHFGIQSLILGSVILLGGLLYDFIKIRLLLLKRKNG
ncbi:YoaK family protein [Chryseobacterium gotjawalense]|uniref:YoaK family protein n=1 Tax=Chryseobacterium gotjawalense TaxID=3042315 RepID=A0ABY8REV9_9FLAO|nr:YoaK family protein [Chryseobacterium sp. wdc7]WHF52249.1 YoaK family protein [Chryseobacterium sp. wdc7]